MKYFCTLSDKNYLRQGLALYKSISENCDDFILEYLCLDIESETILKDINLENINVVNVNELFEKDSQLKELKKSDYKKWCWTLASYYTNFLLKNTKHEYVIYIDSDIIFYNNVDYLFDEIKDKSTGIIRHRHIPLDGESPDGKFNVGIVYFKNDKMGKEICNWWSDSVINEKYPEYATCYDQKYLEGFIEIYGEENVSIIDNVCHGSPWHWRLYDYSKYKETKKIIWEGREEILLFNHFSRFGYDLRNKTMDYTNGNYPDHTLSFSVFEIEAVKDFYQDYFNRLFWVEMNWIKGSLGE